MITNINSEDRLVQATFGDYLRDRLGWENVYAFKTETFGPSGSLGRSDERDVVLGPDLRAAIARLNPDLPEIARQQAFDKLTHVDFSRSMAQHNQTFYGYIRDGVPVSWMDAKSEEQQVHARVIDFTDGVTGGVPNNRFQAVRELKVGDWAFRTTIAAPTSFAMSMALCHVRHATAFTMGQRHVSCQQLLAATLVSDLN